MSIKSSQALVQEALKKIETLNTSEVKDLIEKKEITLIDVRDIREIWKEGTIADAKHIPRGMLEFWLDPDSPYFKDVVVRIKSLVESNFTDERIILYPISVSLWLLIDREMGYNYFK